MNDKFCYIVAGPNGAGKTTFALSLLPSKVRCKNFVNADLIAAGLSPLNPEKASIEAGKLMLAKIEKCVQLGESFAFETTLSGKAYIRKIKQWQRLGYKVILYYFSLPSVELAIERVRVRVAMGGHNIPREVIRRRFGRSVDNLSLYRHVVDACLVYDCSGAEPQRIN